MPQDIIALTPKMPDQQTLLASLYAGGPEAILTQDPDGAHLQLRSPEGQVVVSLEAPLYVQVPGEVERLLGIGAEADAPVWWTEIRATAGVEEARQLAASVAGRLKAVLGGASWPPEVTQVDVVPPRTDTSRADDTVLDVDILTEAAAVVIQNRPVVAATTWLIDALQTAARSGRELQLVTPADVRLTLPMRSLLGRTPSRWVVRDTASGYYDGLTGLALDWQGEMFTPVLGADDAPRLADAYRAGTAPQEQRQLLLAFRAVHPVSEHLVLGEALETAWRTLTGRPPAGWSTAEPVNLPWSPRQLTDLARRRAQGGASTWLTAVGHPDQPAIATTQITHTRAGVEEHTTLALGYAAARSLPLDKLPELAEALATRHHLATMLTHVRTGRFDLTAPAHFEPPAIPVSLTLGSDAVRDIGLAQARQAPATSVEFGPARQPALHYTLGDGTDPAAWHALQRLDQHVKSTRHPRAPSAARR
ncbi:DUF6177 family protein [Streptomyces mesophilus]|uniref:DUF6177 family protein n=1 Tax=Streptomyces mesophilus TaxID=1775132 RepID=UPI00332AD5F5